MKGSLDRVRAVLRGEQPDRPPLCELLRNDAVISHLAGETLTIANGPRVVFAAFAPAVDATRPLVRLPQTERKEVLAGMDVGDIHRRYPHLFLAGGIDVSQLLPSGKPAEVRDAVRRALDAAEGRLMVGSSTELNNEVPLENFLAMREAVLEYRY